MANDSVVANIFGIDPALLYQKQREEDSNYGFKMAQLDAEQAAAAPVYSMTQKLGRQFGNLLGIEDPQMAKNSKILAVKKQAKEMGLDKNSADGMAKYAKLLEEAGLDDVASQAQARAMEMAEKASKIGENQADALLKRAQAAKAGREGKSSQMTLIQEIKAARASGDTETEGILTQALKTGNTEVVEKGIGGKTRQKVLIDKATGKEIAAIGAPYEQGALVENNNSVNSTAGETSEFSKERQKKDAATVSELEKKQADIRASFDKLDTLENLYEKGNLIRGALPDMRLGVAQFFDTFGLGTDKLRASIGDSTTFQAVSGDMVMGMLGGTLGAQVSDADRKFAERMKPMLAQGQGIPDVIEYVRKRAREEAIKNRGEISRVGGRNNMKDDRESQPEFAEAAKAQEVYLKDPAGTLQKAWNANPQVHKKMSMEDFAKAYVRALDKKLRKHI